MIIETELTFPFLVWMGIWFCREEDLLILWKKSLLNGGDRTAGDAHMEKLSDLCDALPIVLKNEIVYDMYKELLIDAHATALGGDPHAAK